MTAKLIGLGAIVGWIFGAAFMWSLNLPSDPLAKFSEAEQGQALQIIGLPLPTCANSVPEGCKSARDRLVEGRLKFATYEPKQARQAILAWYDVAERAIERGEQDEQQRYRIQNALNAIAPPLKAKVQ